MKNSIVSRYVKIEPKAKVNHSIILTQAVIGQGVKVEYAVVDKYAEIYQDIIGTKEKPVYVSQGKVIK